MRFYKKKYASTTLYVQSFLEKKMHATNYYGKKNMMPCNFFTDLTIQSVPFQLKYIYFFYRYFIS
jgi:hypothetical protein